MSKTYKSKRQLIDDLRRELQSQGFDTSGMSDEEIEALCVKAGIEIINIAELN